jgi:hypothetical protein
MVENVSFEKMIYDNVHVTVPPKREVSLNFTEPIWLVAIGTNGYVKLHMDKGHTHKVTFVNSEDRQVDVSILILKHPETKIKVEEKKMESDELGG